MGYVTDLTGKTFGKLTVIKFDEERSFPKHNFWICKCDCERTDLISVNTQNLTSGNTTSCGCLRRENTAISNQAKKRKYNTFDLINYDYGICYASNSNDEILFDLEDYDKIKDYCWFIHLHNKGKYKRVQSRAKETKEIVNIQYIITGEKYLDHINRNPLDNRKSNLRKATSSQNSQNKSVQSNNTTGITGVGYISSNKKPWIARIQYEDSEKKLGYFTNKEDAIRARLQAEKDVYGDFAPQKHLFKEFNIQ